jgi:primosomal protein N'
MVFGPFEAQVYKVNEKYRLRMVIKCKLNRESRGLFHQLLCQSAAERNVTLSIDMNPLTM